MMMSTSTTTGTPVTITDHERPRRDSVPRRTLTTPTLLRIHGTQRDMLSRLPLEIGLYIMDLLATAPPAGATLSAALGNSASPLVCISTRTLCACALVCRYWARLALDDKVWQRHYARVVARQLFHVDPHVLHPLCDFSGLPRRDLACSAASTAGSTTSQVGSGEGVSEHDQEVQDEEESACYLTDRDLIGLLTARAHLGVLDPRALHSLRWCLSLPAVAQRDPALALRRMLVLDHLMRSTHPHWLAPYPPLNFRWLSKWKYACAVARADTRRVVLTSAELVRLCFYMHFNDWDNAIVTRGGGVFPGRLPPTNVSVFCADGEYRTTYYPLDSPIHLYWHWVTERMDGSVIAAAPFVREVGTDDEMSEDDDESCSEDDDEEDDDDVSDAGVSVDRDSRWALQPLLPVGPMTPVAVDAQGAGQTSGLVMPAAMVHARYPVTSEPSSCTSAPAGQDRAGAISWLWSSRPSLERIASAHGKFLHESRFIGRPELPLASTQHYRHRESFLQVDNYLPLTISRNPSTGQWVMLNKYYIFESLQQPVGPGIAWVAMADQHRPKHQHRPPGVHHLDGHHWLPSHPVHPTHPSHP